MSFLCLGPAPWNLPGPWTYLRELPACGEMLASALSIPRKEAERHSRDILSWDAPNKNGAHCLPALCVLFIYSPVSPPSLWENGSSRPGLGSDFLQWISRAANLPRQNHWIENRDWPGHWYLGRKEIIASRSSPFLDTKMETDFIQETGKTLEASVEFSKQFPSSTGSAETGTLQVFGNLKPVHIACSRQSNFPKGSSPRLFQVSFSITRPIGILHSAITAIDHSLIHTQVDWLINQLITLTFIEHPL